MILDQKQSIPWAKPAIDDAELNEVIACMKSGWLSNGPRVAKFEQLMAKRAGRAFGIAVNNGTAALELALMAINLAPGEEVIVPAFSYIATASTVIMQGATPIFCDVDSRNLCVDPASAADRITPQTRAILCTDYGGNPCDFAALVAVADQRGLPLILDGAQSIGTMFGGRPALSYGLISTVSFHAAKTMTTVEGGMVFTDDETLAKRMRVLRSQGEDPGRKYYHIELGHNFRMTELQAAIGLAQLGKLDSFLADRQKLAGQYRNEFGVMGLQMPSEVPGGQNSYFLFSVLLNNRDVVAERLKNRGIETRVCYPLPLYDQPILKRYKKIRCPVAEGACRGILNLPMFFGMTASQQRRIMDEVREAISEQARSAA
jgi:dTDP-4-amino-4,6-dideoxygalactose transaminase